MNLNLHFKSLTEFLAHFKDEETCQKHFAAVRFRDGAYCPHCRHTTIYEFKGGRRYRCAGCKQDFTIKTGTVFGESKLPLKKWFLAIYLLSSSSKGISSIQLAKLVGVTQKTAWFIDHRIREAIKDDGEPLTGSVEVDETYVGGKEKNKHASKRTKHTQGRSTKTKTPVIGMVQRGGEVRAVVEEKVCAKTIKKHILENVSKHSEIYTDEFKAYIPIGKLFPKHQIVRHKDGEYVKGRAHTNTIECFWSLFKRGYIGVYHLMSRKHLQRYVNEFVFRFNNRKTAASTIFLEAVEKVAMSKQLNYQSLTQNKLESI